MNKTPLLLAFAMMSVAVTASAEPFRFSGLNELRSSSALVPIPRAVDMKAATAPAVVEEHDGWMTDHAAAVKKAKDEKKMLFMNFTGSDWCPWCIRLHKEIFDSPEFKKYAAENLVLLELDFPQQKVQSAELRAQNDALQKQYKVDGFPTFLVFDPEGRQLFERGYVKGWVPADYVNALQKLK